MEVGTRMDLSVIIPARNEIYLEQTIRNVLSNIRGNTEIIVVLDGYLPDPQIHTEDTRVRFEHFPEAIGQRAAINHAARLSQAKFIMKLDAHCAVDEGFDVKLMETCKYDWTVIPRMYNLDIATWMPKRHKRTDYMYIGNAPGRKLRAEYYNYGQPGNDLPIDDIMCCMGPCFFMHRDRFWELGGCDEGHGSWGQQGVEVSLKAWLSGGALKVNKTTWFAHWFRGGEGPGFPYPISGSDQERAREYSQDLWLNDKWPQAVRSLQWVIDKFNPPGWETSAARDSEAKLHEKMYREVHLAKNDPQWRGLKLIKMPTDIVLYQEAIWAKRPDFIVEIGTAFCASALMFADFLEMTGKGHVISIDPNPRGPLINHPRVTYLKGDSKNDAIIDQVKAIVGKGSVMLSIDGNHSRSQVKWELKKYRDVVTPGQYMVVEDCYGRKGELVGPGEARDWFLSWNNKYRLTDFGKRFLYGVTRNGWLERVQ